MIRVRISQLLRFFFPKEEEEMIVCFRASRWSGGIGLALILLPMLGAVSSLHAAEKVSVSGALSNLAGGVPLTDERGDDLDPSWIIQVGAFNNSASPFTTPLNDAQILALLTGSVSGVRDNLNNVFGAGKPTLWGSTDVQAVFYDGAYLSELRNTSSTIFAGNPVYVLVCNSTSIATATEIGIFVFLDGTGSRAGFPPIGSGGSEDLIVEFDGDDFNGRNMFPIFGSFDSADGNYRLASLGNTYGITSSLTAEGTRDNAFSYLVTANNGATAFGAGPLPDGLSIDSTTGEVSGILTAAAGTYPVVLTATGPLGDSTATLVITVSNLAAGSPVISSSQDDQSAVAGVVYSGYTITADNSPTSYSAAGLPRGLSCDPTTGIISGTPTVTGTFNVIIRATNTNGTGTGSFSLVVAAPVLTYPESSITLNTSGSTAAPTGTDGFAPDSYFASNLPPGISIDIGTGVISGTPTAIGSYNVTVLGSSTGGVSALGTAVIKVTSQRPTLNSPTVVAGSIGTPLTYTLTTTLNPNAVAPDFYSLLPSSNVPNSWKSGKLNDQTGVFQVTPTSTEWGVFTLKFQANNGVSAAGLGGGESEILTVTVTIEVPPPTLADGDNATTYVTIGGTDYVSMAVGATKSFSINHFAGSTLSFSDLPSWMKGTTSGPTVSVTGRPTVAGTYRIRKTASNTTRLGVVQSVSRDLVITVVGSSPSAAGSGFVLPPAGRVGQDYRQYVTAAGATRSAADPVSFNASTLPPGLSFATAADRQMGLLTGRPTRAGTYAVKFFIANPRGFITQNATMTILP